METRNILIIVIIAIIAVAGLSASYAFGMFPNTYSAFTHTVNCTNDEGNYTIDVPTDVNLVKNTTNNTTVYQSNTDDKFNLATVGNDNIDGVSTISLMLDMMDKNKSFKKIKADLFTNNSTYQNITIYEINDTKLINESGKYKLIGLVNNNIISITGNDPNVLEKSLKSVKIKKHISKNLTTGGSGSVSGIDKDLLAKLLALLFLQAIADAFNDYDDSSAYDSGTDYDDSYDNSYDSYNDDYDDYDDNYYDDYDDNYYDDSSYYYDDYNY